MIRQVVLMQNIQDIRGIKMKINHLKIRLIMITFVSTIVLSSCIGGDHKVEKVYKKKCLAAFVQARTTSSGLESPSYGDVIIYDLEDGLSANITDDKYFDLDPSWSPSGDKLLFQSNREETQLDLDIVGIGGPHKVYYYDFNLHRLQRIEIPYETDRPKFLRSTLEDLQWYGGEQRFIFNYALDNKIFITSIEKDTTIVFKELDKFKIIWEIVVCSLTKAIAFKYEGTIYNPKAVGAAYIDSTATKVRQICETEVYIGGWSNDGESLLYIQGDSVVVEYNLRTQKHEVVFKYDKDFNIDKPFYSGDTGIVFLARYEDKDTHELYLYDRKSKYLKKLTNNGLDKKWLSVRVCK